MVSGSEIIGMGTEFKSGHTAKCIWVIGNSIRQMDKVNLSTLTILGTRALGSKICIMVLVCIATQMVHRMRVNGKMIFKKVKGYLSGTMVLNMMGIFVKGLSTIREHFIGKTVPVLRVNGAWV